MFDVRKILGMAGEREAVRFLKKNGCRIIETNYRNRLGEIDVIALDGDVIVFAEVKTREKGGPVSPKEAVTLRKQRKMVKVAESWLKEMKKTGSRARFDVIAILSENNDKRIEWVKHAFHT